LLSCSIRSDEERKKEIKKENNKLFHASVWWLFLLLISSSSSFCKLFHLRIISEDCSGKEEFITPFPQELFNKIRFRVWDDDDRWQTLINIYV